MSRRRLQFFLGRLADKRIQLSPVTITLTAVDPTVQHQIQLAPVVLTLTPVDPAIDREIQLDPVVLTLIVNSPIVRGIGIARRLGSRIRLGRLFRG